MARDIPFHSLCAHHLQPFVGVAHVAYIPGERIVGLSKLARLVEHFARRLQTQEYLTSRVAHALSDSLAPRGAGVVVEAEHLCMSLRGVGARSGRTVTTSVTGLVRRPGDTRRVLGARHGPVERHTILRRRLRDDEVAATVRRVWAKPLA